MTATSYEQKLKQRYAGVRARLLSARPKPKLVTVEAPKASGVVVPVRPISHIVTYRPPEWKTHPHEHDWHVIEWRITLFKNMDTPRNYLRRRCEELGISVERVCGPQRQRWLVDIRQQLIHEIWAKFSLSTPQLGRLFGGRDHTTCLWAVRKIEARNRGEKLERGNGWKRETAPSPQLRK